MRRAVLVGIGVMVAVPLAFGQGIVTDDFNSGFSGWSAAVPQYSADATGGIGGSGGLDFSKDANANKGAIHGTGVSAPAGAGNTVTASAWFQFGITGTALSDTNAPNVNGVNDSMLGMRVSDTANWWDGNNAGLQIARRHDGYWGVRLPVDPWISGWNGNDELGFPNNSGAAGSSDWFKMELVLTDTGGATYDMLLNVYEPDGTTLAMATPTVPTSLAVGSTLYGGFWNGWYEAGSTLEQQSKVDSMKIDDFSLVAVPEPATVGLLGLGLLGLLARRRR